MTKTKSNLYEQWIEAKSKLDYYKKLEADLRMKICVPLDKKSVVGVNNFTEGGFIVKMTKKVNTTIQSKELDEHWAELSPMAKECFIFKPSLVAKVYKSLKDDVQQEVDQFLVVKPGMPSLEIKQAEETE